MSVRELPEQLVGNLTGVLPLERVHAQAARKRISSSTTRPSGLSERSTPISPTAFAASSAHLGSRCTVAQMSRLRLAPK